MGKLGGEVGEFRKIAKVKRYSNGKVQAHETKKKKKEVVGDGEEVLVGVDIGTGDDGEGWEEGDRRTEMVKGGEGGCAERSVEGKRW